MFFGPPARLELLLGTIFGNSDSDTEPETETSSSFPKNARLLPCLSTIHSLTNVVAQLPLPEPVPSDIPSLLSEVQKNQFQQLEHQGLSKTTAMEVGHALAKVPDAVLPLGGKNNALWIARHSPLTSFVAKVVPSAFQGKSTHDKLEAKNMFLRYACALRNQLSDKEGLGGKLIAEDTDMIHKVEFLLSTNYDWHFQVINDKISWLEKNPDANADVLIEQRKELEDVVHPIISIL